MNTHEQNKAAIQLIINIKYRVRKATRLRERMKGQIKSMKLAGVQIGLNKYNEQVESFGSLIKECNQSLWQLIKVYDATTLRPSLHDRAQLLSVSHIALMKHRKGIEEATGELLDCSLVTDSLMHGEIAGDLPCDFIGERCARDYPLFNACMNNILKDVPMDGVFEGWLDEDKAKRKQAALDERQARRSHLKVVA